MTKTTQDFHNPTNDDKALIPYSKQPTTTEGLVKRAVETSLTTYET